MSRKNKQKRKSTTQATYSTGEKANVTVTLGTCSRRALTDTTLQVCGLRQSQWSLTHHKHYLSQCTGIWFSGKGCSSSNQEHKCQQPPHIHRFANLCIFSWQWPLTILLQMYTTPAYLEGGPWWNNLPKGLSLGSITQLGMLRTIQLCTCFSFINQRY